MLTQVVDPAPTKLSPEAFETMLTRAGEAGAKTYAEAHKPAEPETAPQKPESAPAEQPAMVGSAVDSLDNIGGLGIPFGSVLIGVIPGVVVGEVLDGAISPLNKKGDLNWMNPAAKIGVAYLGIQYGSKLIGHTGAMFFAGSLVMQALVKVLPIDEWVAKLVKQTKKVTDAVTEAEQIVRHAQMGQDSPRYGTEQRGGMWA